MSEQTFEELLTSAKPFITRLWQRRITAQYPEDKYIIQWTPEGAQIYDIEAQKESALYRMALRREPYARRAQIAEIKHTYGEWMTGLLEQIPHLQEFSGTYLTPKRELPPGTVAPLYPSPYQQYYEEEAQKLRVKGFEVPTYGEAWKTALETVPKPSKIISVTPTEIEYVTPPPKAEKQFGIFEPMPVTDVYRPPETQIIVPTVKERWEELAPKKPIEFLEPKYLYPMITVGAVLLPPTIATIKEAIPESIKIPLAKAELAIKFKEPFYTLRTIPQKLETWLMKHGLITPKLAPMEVGEALPYRIGLPELKASQLAWELQQFPKTSGVYWAKISGEIAEPSKPFQVLVHVGKVGIWELREVKLTPIVTQTQLTRMGIIPYAPKLTASTISTGMKPILAGLTAATLLRGFPQITPKPERKYKTKLVPIIKPYPFVFETEKLKFKGFEEARFKEKERERIVPILKLPSIQSVTQISKQLQSTLQIQRMPYRLTPTPIVPKPPVWWPRLPEGGIYPKRRKDLFGKWFLRTHPIPTASQFAKQWGVTGKPKKVAVRGKGKATFPTVSQLAKELKKPLRRR